MREECSRFVEMMQEELDGTLRPEERPVLEEHVSRCESCASEADSLRRTVSLLENMRPVEPAEPTEAFVRSVLLRASAARRAKAAMAGWAWASGIGTILAASLVLATWAGMVQPAAAGMAGAVVEAARNLLVLLEALAVPAHVTITLLDALGGELAPIALGGFRSTLVAYAAALGLMVAASALGLMKPKATGLPLLCF